MRKFEKIRPKVAALRATWQQHEQTAYAHRQAALLLRAKLDHRRREQGSTTPIEQEPEWDELQALHSRVAAAEQKKAEARGKLADEEKSLHDLGSPQQLLQALSDDIPILLLPLRVHTRFVRVKHIVKAAREHLLDIDDQAALAIDGLSAAQGNWAEAGPKEIWTLQHLATTGGREQRQLSKRLLQQLQRQTNPNQQWLKQQQDTYELLVRIYPDDVFVHSHETALAPEELQAGKDFWLQYWEIEAAHTAEEAQAEKQEKLIAAWKKLQDAFLPARAAWIYRSTKPGNFPPTAAEGFAGQPDFSQLQAPLRSSEWTQPMRSYVLPERFVVRLYHKEKAEDFVGNPIVYPLALSHDPLATAPDSEEIPDEIRWITDFPQAEKIGMAVRIPLSRETYDEGIERLVVAGVNVTWNETESKTALEELLLNHRYKEGGMAIVPQGTPTNNFDDKRSGYSFYGPEPAQVFAAVHQGISTATDLHWSEKRDGHYLTEQLQLDPALMRHLVGADGRDIAGAIAMNHLLWPATLGYYLDQFFRPLINSQTLEALRQYFTACVSGRGRLPVLRIGQQPYGILATTDFTQLAFPTEADPLLEHLYTRVLQPLDRYWDRLKDQVHHLHNLQAGEGVDSLHKYSPELVKMIDLHASSETFFHRPIMGEYLVWNAFRASFPGREADIEVSDKTFLDKWPTSFLWGGQAGREYFLPTDLSRRLRRIFPHLSSISKEELEKNRVFQQHHPVNFRQLAAQTVDQFPPSEQRRLSVLEGQTQNYLQRLYALRATEMRELIRSGTSVQEGEPRSLLYLLARQAIARAYLEAALAPTADRHALISRMDLELEHLTAAADPSPGQEAIRFVKKLTGSSGVQQQVYKKNKWDYLDTPTATALDEHLQQVLDDNRDGSLTDSIQRLPPQVAKLAAMKLALRQLNEQSTAGLHRLFSEHIDLCSYRLDAWFQGLIHQRLDERSTKGLFLGAYGYLEKVQRGAAPAVIFREIKRVEKVGPRRGGGFGGAGGRLPNGIVIPVLHLRSFQRTDLDLDTVLKDSWIYLGEDFGTEMTYDAAEPGRVVAAPLVDSRGQGFMHTPSQAHAITAAILRSGFIADNPQQDHEAFAINLSSARVRQALYLIEGVKQGQELPELLGYQFERFLHDQDDLPLDEYILDIRKRFPLKAGPTTLDPEKAISDQQAYRVVDGWALTQFYRSRPPAQARQLLQQTFNIAAHHLDQFIEAIERLNSQVDAVSDLFLSESVYQVARGNLGRAATALKMFNNEAELDVPEMLRDPNPHKLLSQLVGIQFDNRATGAAWPGELSDLALISAPLNHWLATQLPEPGRVMIPVEVAGQQSRLSLQELQWQPIDLLAAFQEQEVFSEAGALTEQIRSLLMARSPGAQQEDIRIHYQDSSNLTAEEVNLAELKPLLFSLNTVLRHSRPMLPTDLQRSTRTDLPGDHPMPTLNNDRLLDAFRTVGLGEKITEIEAIEDKHTQWQALDRLGKERWGEATLIIPEFELANQAAFGAAFQFPDLLAAAEQPEFAVEEWLQGLAQVRVPLRAWQQFRQWQKILGLADADQAPKIVQLPFDPDPENYRWLGIPYPESIQIAGDVLSIVLHLPPDFNLQDRMSGLVIDHWREALPERTATTGIAMHYDQPNVEPPQVMLLCVSPDLSGQWDWDKLCNIVTDTMERAKKRAIDPDLIADGSEDDPFQYLLPAVVAPICDNGETPWVNFAVSEFLLVTSR